MSKLKVFISYASEDSTRARDMYRRLSDCGYEPWLDTECLLPGQRWEHEIKKAIKSAHIFLLLLTGNSTAKRGVLQKEIRVALDTQQEKLNSDVFIIPVRVENCSIPEGLGEIQTANLFEERGWEKLIQILDAQRAALFGIDTIEGPPQLSVPEWRLRHDSDRGDRYEIQILAIDEGSESTHVADCFMSTEALAAFAKRGQATAVAQFFYLTGNILENPDLVFRGLVRPSSSSEGHDAVNENIYVYVGTPAFDMEWAENRERGLVKHSAPKGRVFVIVLSRLIESGAQAVEHWRIEHWHWAVEDSLVKGAPEGWATRYRKLIFKR